MQVRRTRRGSMMVLAIGMTILVSFLTTSQLTNLKVAMDARYRTDHARQADIAARSGLDYGYAMIKNTLDTMSMVGPRFATHFWDDNAGVTGGMVADIPPYWQEVLNVQYDRRAFEDRGIDADVANNHTGNWVGTDSFWTHQHNVVSIEDDPDAASEVPWPFDYTQARSFYSGLADATHLRETSADVTINSAVSPDNPGGSADTGFDAFTLGYHSRLRSCPRWESNGGTDLVTQVLYPEATYSATSGDSQCHYLRMEGLRKEGLSFSAALTQAENDPWGYNSLSGDWYLDGHFGDKRWHYYDAFTFDNVTPATISAERGTGGSIVTGRDDFPIDTTAGDGTFEDYREHLFERLFYYRFDPAETQYPHEPGDWTQTEAYLQQATEQAYTVQMFSALDLDFIDDGSTTAENLMRHTDYGNVQHKVFFKIWITRDQEKNGYAGEAFTPPATWPIQSNFLGQPYKTWDGSEITGQNNDLHPLWTIPRTSGNLQTALSSGGKYASRDVIPVQQTSLYRPDYKIDFLDTDGDGDDSDALGVLQWPVPYLAMQRGDYDLFEDSVRGDTDATTIPIERDEYTKFTLWSLGMVMVPNMERLREDRLITGDAIVPENEQRITDFDVTARALYKMEFLVDVRAPDVHDQRTYLDYSKDEDGAEFNTGSLRVNPSDGSVGPWACGTRGDRANPANEPFYNSRFVPICDLSPDASKTVVMEPKGILMLNTERVEYRASGLP